MAMAKLVEITGYTPGREIPIRGSLVIGRDPGSGGLVIANREASRRHARVYREGPHYFVEDLESANGTFIDGVRQHRVQVANGSELTIGRTTFRFTLNDEAPGERQDPPGFRVRMSDKHPEIAGVRAEQDRSEQKIRTPPPASNASPKEAPPRLHPNSRNRPPNPVWNLTMDARATAIQPNKSGADRLDKEILKRERDILNHLSEISRTIGSILHLPELVQSILHKLFELFPAAQKASIHLMESDALKPLEARSRDGGPIPPPPISQTISSMALLDRQSILSTDAAEDERFQGKKSIILQKVHSFMCSPLLFQEDALGVLYVDTTDVGPRFSSDDLQLFTAVSSQVAVAVKNSQLMAQNIRDAEVRMHLSRYLPPDLVEQVLHKQIDLNPGGSLQRGTVLFSDIVGFTPLAERLGPEALVQTLNRYFKYMVDKVFKNGGSVNAFGGDSIMALWGVPVYHENDTLRAVRAAIEMQAAVFGFNLTWRDGATYPLKVGIGINSGSFVVGNVGSERHMQYTALGNEVNLAQRVESQAAGWQVFLSKSTFEQVEAAAAVFSLPPKSLKGVASPMPIYSIRALKVGEEVICAIPTKLKRLDGSMWPGMAIAFRGGKHLVVLSGLEPRSEEFLGIQLNPLEAPEDYAGAGMVYEACLLEEYPTDGDRQTFALTIEMEGEIPKILLPPLILEPHPDREYLPRR